MSDIRQPLYGTAAREVQEALRRSGAPIDFRDPQNRKVAHEAIRRTRVPHSHVRAEIAGHGQFQCTAADLDALIEAHWGDSRAKLVADIKEAQGDPEYDTHGMAKIELIMVIAELSGFATN